MFQLTNPPQDCDLRPPAGPGTHTAVVNGDLRPSRRDTTLPPRPKVCENQTGVPSMRQMPRWGWAAAAGWIQHDVHFKRRMR